MRHVDHRVRRAVVLDHLSRQADEEPHSEACRKDTEDPDTFFFMRGFPDLASREPMKAKFYEGELWKSELENVLLSMLENYEVVVVEDADKGQRCRAAGGASGNNFAPRNGRHSNNNRSGEGFAFAAKKEEEQ